MIITLCGSNRFEPYFKAWNEALSLAGHAVFTLAVYASQKQGNPVWYTEEEKLVLDQVHKAKIQASDAILVLNAFAYIGESTMSEIDYAKEQGKQIFMLESWGKGCGVSKNHFPEWQEAKARYGIPADYMSPIDTFGNAGFYQRWSTDLLGERRPNQN